MKPAPATLLLLLFALASAAPLAAGEEPNTLSAAEKEAGWKLLFDGLRIEGWRGYKAGSEPGEGWVVEDGALQKQGGARPGDIMTVDVYENHKDPCWYRNIKIRELPQPAAPAR